ncbi:hypothetical protein PFICI_10388 [Pestalotiopsis fici W106-1]|uniref:Uncharacterized protein n=1 Tax=Pestalotiopsis fici (strain W106-1 / CGMCC3.15140) TaxID=1229662 RepID=W3WZL6_PESFW|nr:uncharacterized protein PFICI_10388 [Pestalotiopsis fici W106-1]ETS78326.1 hypothetical protein PFICI_10388 [Pestalotiopsis fici W106-1]
MSDRSPELSHWEDIGVDSDDEQVFYLDGEYKPAEDATSDSWAIVKPKQITLLDINRTERQNCSHFASKGCALETSGQCCECSDKRPINTSGLYSMYVDGQGWVENATRWAYYCPACREHEQTTILNQMMEKLLKVAAQKELERRQLSMHQCEHWLERGCVITSTGKCCACSDLRPGDRYEVYRSYVDGLGLTGDISRWEHYCPGCKEYEEIRDHPANADTNLTTQNQTVLFMETNLDNHYDVTALPASPKCSHFLQRGCLMSVTGGKCCACADRRVHTESGLYAKYVDGQGWVQNAKRWEGYCPNCRQICSQISIYTPQTTQEPKYKKRMQQPEYKGRSKKAKQHHKRDTKEGCDHWASKNCALTSTPKRCCACSDKRPEAPSYPVYVDGMGWIMGAKRWSQYCPDCRNHDELAEPKSRRRRHLQMPKVVGLLC